MNKLTKISLILAATSIAATSWGAATTIAASTSGTATATAAAATFTALQEDVTIKLSKGVLGAYDLTQLGGTVGVATGTTAGRGFIYPNGTSLTSTNLAPINVSTGASVTTSAAATAAQNAAS